AARQVGGALGVAVLGSVWASSYAHALAAPALRATVTPSALQASRSSVGAALAAARGLPAPAAQSLVATAKEAFVHGSNVAGVVGLGPPRRRRLPSRPLPGGARRHHPRRALAAAGAVPPGAAGRPPRDPRDRLRGSRRAGCARTGSRGAGSRGRRRLSRPPR